MKHGGWGQVVLSNNKGSLSTKGKACNTYTLLSSNSLTFDF